jgi:membrane protease YdiL (CAAX protease family)
VQTSTKRPLPSEAPATSARTFTLLLLAALIVTWFVLVSRFGQGDVYAVIGPYACLVCVVAVAVDAAHLRGLLEPQLRAAAIGLAVGVGMTALTYPVFELAASQLPWLRGTVSSLYSGARSTTLPKALLWILAAVLAEELMFRGAWLHALSQRVSQRQAAAISIATYTLAQFGTGSVIVMLMALVCGTIWTVQRIYTGSLLSPLLSHLIWTPTVILLHPVT